MSSSSLNELPDCDAGAPVLEKIAREHAARHRLSLKAAIEQVRKVVRDIGANSELRQLPVQSRLAETRLGLGL